MMTPSELPDFLAILDGVNGPIHVQIQGTGINELLPTSSVSWLDVIMSHHILDLDSYKEEFQEAFPSTTVNPNT